MSNPFKKTVNNANKSKIDWGNNRENSEAKTRKCEGCGAARPKDTNLTTCDYCGFKFMQIDESIKPEI